MSKPDKTAKRITLVIILSALVIFFLVESIALLLPHRIMLTAKLLLLVVSIAAGLLSPRPREPKKRKRKLHPRFGIFHEICFSIAIALFLVLLFDSGDYSYTQGFPFWLAALIITIPLGAALVLATPKKVFETKSGIGWILLGALILGFVLWFAVHSFIVHLNYALDVTKPTEYTAVIEDKEHHRNRKSPDVYEFEFTIDGETFDLEVNWLIYDDYEIGDIFSFYRYNGAFRKPFYLSDPSHTKGGTSASP